ncbi:MAG: hypothetical protein PWR01_3690, partial [Clostridiales bacterium]|nr:hypothetical protein [Clostridiales bacterium]MDN5282617.1 hypothetical protein [Candidatus Ozemobacter sp.]
MKVGKWYFIIFISMGAYFQLTKKFAAQFVYNAFNLVGFMRFFGDD